MEHLVADRVTVRFGGLAALDSFDLVVHPREIHGVIGPNGAGKTTLLNAISGIYHPDDGTIRLLGHQIEGLRADKIARLGLARTFQNTELFHGMSVLENVLVGLDTRRSPALLRPRRWLPRAQGGKPEVERAKEILQYVGLAQTDVPAGTLPFGQQRLLELARALALEPTVLLLDEPAAGMNSREIEHVKEVLFRLRQEFGVTIVMVEHVMDLVMDVCDTLTVASEGRRLAVGAPKEVRQQREVLEAYLGGGNGVA